MNPATTLDQLDRAVVTALGAAGRATYAEVGARVGLSASAVKRRVDRLVDTGVIRGFTALVDPAALGWATEAYVEVRYSGKVSPGRLRSDVVGFPEVVGAWTVTGQADVVLHVLARDVHHLEATLQRIRELPDVAGTTTDIVLSCLFRRSVE